MTLPLLRSTLKVRLSTVWPVWLRSTVWNWACSGQVRAVECGVSLACTLGKPSRTARYCRSDCATTCNKQSDDIACHTCATDLN